MLLEDGKGVVGPPDLVIEILSPSTANHDRITKLNLYMQSGVREYWIVDPDGKTVTVHVLHSGIGYVIRAYDNSTEFIPVEVVEGCNINLHEVFK